MSKHEIHATRRDTFANRPEGRIRRDERRNARNAKQAFAYMGAA